MTQFIKVLEYALIILALILCFTSCQDEPIEPKEPLCYNCGKFPDEKLDK